MAKPPPSLLDNAVSAVQNVHALSVGLAHAGANPDVLKQLTQCGELLTQVVRALGNGPSLDQASGGAQPAGPPQGQPAGPPPEAAGPPPGPPQAVPAPEPQQDPVIKHTMASAAAALQAAHAAANRPK